MPCLHIREKYFNFVCPHYINDINQNAKSMMSYGTHGALIHDEKSICRVDSGLHSAFPDLAAWPNTGGCKAKLHKDFTV